MQCEGQALALRGPGTISYAETGTGKRFLLDNPLVNTRQEIRYEDPNCY